MQHRVLTAAALMPLGTLALERGDLGEARARLTEGLPLFVAARMPAGLPVALEQFAALVEPRAVGALTAFVEVTFEGPGGHDEFRQAVGRLVAVQECHRIAGGAHFLIKVRARSTGEMEHFLAAVLPQAARGATCRAAMVLRTIKETTVYPLPRTLQLP